MLQQTITTTTDTLPFLDEVEEECTTDVAFSAPPNMNELLQQFRENLFAFMLKCREKNHLPQSVQQEILDNVNFLFSFFKENYDEFLAYHLEKMALILQHVQNFKKCYSPQTFFQRPQDLLGLHTCSKSFVNQNLS